MGAPPVGQERLTDARTIARAVTMKEERPSKRMIVLHPGDSSASTSPAAPATATRSTAIRPRCWPTCWTARSRRSAWRRTYGVVLTPEGTAVDEVLAKERRAARRRAR
jgi:hypothetical protein